MKLFFCYFFLQCIPASNEWGRGVWAGAGAGLVLVGCRVIAFCAAVEFKWIQYCIFTLKCAQKQIFHLHFLNGEIRITYPTGTKHWFWFCFCAVPHAACSRGKGSRRHRWSEVSACFWSTRLSVKGSDESLPAAAPLLLSTCTISSHTSLPLLSVSFNTFSERTPLTFSMPFVGQRIRFRTFSLLQN